MRFEQRRARKSGLRRQILHDHRTAGGERIAGLRVAGGGNIGGADQPRVPSDAGSEQKLGVARNQFEDFHHFEVEHLPDRGDHLVEEFLQIAFGERPFAEPRERFLLARTHTNLAIDAQAFGHIATHAEKLHRRAVLHDDGD